MTELSSFSITTNLRLSLLSRISTNNRPWGFLSPSFVESQKPFLAKNSDDNWDEQEDLLEDLEDIEEDEAPANQDEGDNIKMMLKDEEDDDDDDKIDEIALELEDEEEEEDDEEDLYDQEYDSPNSEQTVEWDEDEDGGVYELEDDPEDPNYMIQKQMAEQAAEVAAQRAEDEAFDAVDFIENEMTEEDFKLFDNADFMKEVEKQTEGMMLTSEDVEELTMEDVEAVPSLLTDDPYPIHDESETNFIEKGLGITDEDMTKYDNAYRDLSKVVSEEPWNKVLHKDQVGWNNLTASTMEELEDCLDEIGGSAYNVSRWLLYDLDFNVSNLILSAIKHNPDAPVLFQHWYPQLVTYKRYQHARDRDFDFTWDDVENADMSELERYYAGFGYSEIPEKAPAETGIIGLEEMDEEELKMASFENWMTKVYNPEWDRKDFDDDTMQDEDNVFSHFYEAPQHPDLPVFEDAVEDVEQWEEEMGDDPSVHEYRDMMGKTYEYTLVQDEEFEREFRGHVVVACSTDSEDLEIAGKITNRFEKEFGKQVYVETRVMSLAREDDNVFEVWLESYEIDLLHSKKRATSNSEDWSGPAECDDKQIEYLVDQVRFLISDDARYSYTIELEHAD